MILPSTDKEAIFVDLQISFFISFYFYFLICGYFSPICKVIASKSICDGVY
jgi:hypothetical protein